MIHALILSCDAQSKYFATAKNVHTLGAESSFGSPFSMAWTRRSMADRWRSGVYSGKISAGCLCSCAAAAFGFLVGAFGKVELGETTSVASTGIAGCRGEVPLAEGSPASSRGTF